MSRGLRNNNPGNIRHNKDVFQGEKTPSTDAAFKQFTSMAYGYRAMFVTLGTYLSRGKNTIDKIIRSWAPPNENNTQGYIRHVEQFSGVDRNKVLTACSGDDYIRIAAAMSRIENGVPAEMKEVLSGFELQNKIRK